MSKAFTSEETPPGDDDDAPEPSPLPPGSRNYMTPGGFARLRRELEALVSKERPELVATVAWAAGNGDRSENGDYIYGKKRLREIDRRIRFLVQPARQRRSRRSRGAARRRHGIAGVLRCDRHRRRCARGRADDQHRRHRRDRHRARLHQLDLADRPCADEGARRRHGHAEDSRRRRGTRGRCRFDTSASTPVDAPPMRPL